MKVYHASNIKIDRPDVIHSRNALDFGRGFYVTRLKDQAEKYAKRFTALGEIAYIHEYECVTCGILNAKVFDSYDEEWLRFVCNCRQGGDSYLAYDIVEGGVANDKVFRTVDLFMAGIYTLDQALQNLVYEKPNHQICFITQKAIDNCLRLINCYELKMDENG